MAEGRLCVKAKVSTACCVAQNQRGSANEVKFVEHMVAGVLWAYGIRMGDSGRDLGMGVRYTLRLVIGDSLWGRSCFYASRLNKSQNGSRRNRSQKGFTG